MKTEFFNRIGQKFPLIASALDGPIRPEFTASEFRLDSRNLLLERWLPLHDESLLLTLMCGLLQALDITILRKKSGHITSAMVECVERSRK